jgi:hypothetical protein
LPTSRSPSESAFLQRRLRTHCTRPAAALGRAAARSPRRPAA